DLGVARDHRLERLRLDEEALGLLDDSRGRRPRLAVQDRHLAEELPRAEHGEDLLLPADLLRDPDGAALDDEHDLPGLPLAEEDVARRELAAETGEQGIGHRR